VRCLVGVDAGVFDQPKTRAADVGVLIGRDAPDRRRTIQPDVKVARTRDLDRRHALRQLSSQLGGQLGCDRAGRLAQTLGQLERHGQGQLAEGYIGRLLYD
jgi:hypothetical protein